MTAWATMKWMPQRDYGKVFQRVWQNESLLIIP